jgi:hypothetical protein
MRPFYGVSSFFSQGEPDASIDLYESRFRLSDEAGHMIYIRPSVHKPLKRDVAKFIESTRTAGRPTSTSQP